MSLKFYLGASGAGKSYKVYDDVLRLAEQQPNKRFFIVVPDQYTMEIQKHLVSHSKAHGITNTEILSFKRLAYKIFEELGEPESLALDDTGKNLLVRSIALKHCDELPTLGKSLNKMGFVHEAKSVISEFMQYSISPEQVLVLTKCAENRPALKSKLSDMEFIYREFMQTLSDKYITPEGILALLADKIPSSKLIKDSIIVLDGFTGFTPIQNRVISAALPVCDQMWVTLTTDKAGMESSESQLDLFSLSRKTYDSMCRLAKECGVSRLEDVTLWDQTIYRFKDNPQLAFLEKNLLRNDAKVYTDPSDSVFMAVADNPREELRHVCIKIKKLIADKKLAYRDIAIVSGDLGVYEPYAKELFKQYEIPGFVDSTRHIVLNPFIEFIKSSLEIISSNFSYESVFHFLRSGLCDIDRDQVDILDEYVVALGIRGRSKWINEFSRYATSMKEYDSDSRSYKVTEASLDKLMYINSIRRKVIGILEPLLVLGTRKVMTASDISKALYQFIAASDLHSALLEYSDRFAEAEDYAREKEYSQIYDSFMNLLDTMAGILADEEMTVDEYTKILEAGISELKVGVIPQGVDYVILGDIERTRLSGIKYLFFVGINDGIVPKNADGGGIISDLDREFLKTALEDTGLELAPSPRQKMHIQKLYLYLNITKPSEGLYLSYSRMDSQGSSLLPSYLISTICKYFPGITVTDCNKLSPIETVVGHRDAYSVLSRNMNMFASGLLTDEDKPFFDSLYALLLEDDAARTSSIVKGATYRYQSTRLSGAMVKAIYGARLNISVSRLERYAGCAFAHFLADGLRLKEKEEYSFDSRGVGNVDHDVLSRFSAKLKEQKKSWANISREEAEFLLDQIITEVTSQYGESVIFDSARATYQVKRIKRILLRSVMSIAYQLRKGKFEPDEMEYRVKHEIDIDKVKVGLDEDEKVILGGSVDRLDIAKDGDRLYVKVVDYKSGDRNIDLVQFYRGLSLQLVVYLDQSVKKLKKLNRDKEVIPAAMFYYPMQDPIIETDEAMDEAAINAAITKQLRVKGYFADDETVIGLLDSEFTTESDVIHAKRLKNLSLDTRSSHNLSVTDFHNMLKFSEKKVTELSEDILMGNIEASPAVYDNDRDACTYCSFRQTCGFDTKVEGYKFRRPDITKSEVLERIRMELSDGRD